MLREQFVLFAGGVWNAPDLRVCTTWLATSSSATKSVGVAQTPFMSVSLGNILPSDWRLASRWPVHLPRGYRARC